MTKILKNIIHICFILLFLFSILIAGIFCYWTLRPNTANVDPTLNVESWDVDTTYAHNAFTDLIQYKNEFYLSFRVAPSHGDPNAKILVLKSQDAKNWELSQEFQLEGRDIRDPKLAIIKDNLFIYVISAIAQDDPTTTTFYSFTLDGVNWEPLDEIEPKFKRIWRPRTYNNQDWYSPIFRDNSVGLYKSQDGINWDIVSTIKDGSGADETDLVFLPDGRILATIRMQTESIIGTSEKATLISVSNYPYTSWNQTPSIYNRLDGPCLLTYDDKIFAIGRYQPEVDGFLQLTGNGIGKKRTALFLVEEDKLIYLSDLPSCGDTSYPGAVITNGKLFISYYTSDISKDYPWMLGMISSTKVRIVQMDTTNLIDLAEEKYQKYNSGDMNYTNFPWLDYVVVIGLNSILCFIGFKTISNTIKKKEN